MKLIVFTEFCDDLEYHWKSLEKTAQFHVFQTYSWASYWQKTIGQHNLNSRPWIAVILDDSEKSKLIFPLSIRTHMGARILEFLGGDQGDYQGPLIDDSYISESELIASAWKMIIKELPGHDICHFKKLPAQWLIHENPLLNLFNVKPYQDSSYSVMLPNNFDEFRLGQRKKFRGDTKRQRRRLSEVGDIEFKVFDNNDQHFSKELGVMIEQKQFRCRAMHVPDIFANKTVQKFYQEISGSIKNSHIHFSILKLDDKILATHWGAVHKGRFYYLMPTITIDKLSVYSPGRLLLENLVEWSIQNKLTEFDFTIGGEEYKRDWCDSEMLLFEYFKVNTLFGFPYFIYSKLIRKVRDNKKVWRLVKRIYAILVYRK